MGAPALPTADRIAALEAEIARLAASESMYRTAMELSGRMAWAADAGGAVTVMRTPFSTVTGVADEDAMGEGWLSIVHAEDRDRVKQVWRAAAASGEPYDCEFRARRADGTHRLMRSRAVPRRGEDQSILGWTGTTEDIEEKRHSEQARRDAEDRLRESEEMHRLTIELMRQIIWTTEADGRGLVLSPRYREITGMGEDEEAELSIHPDDRAATSAAWAEAVAASRPFSTECRLIMADGSHRAFRVRAVPRRDEAGRITRWHGISEDVQDQKEAEHARRDVEERYRLAAMATNDAIWDSDLIADATDWSDNAAAILGSSISPLGRSEGTWWKNRVHPDDRAGALQSFEKAIESGDRRWSATYRFLRDDGSYADIFDRGFIIRDAEGQAIRAVGAMADLTERHRAEAEMRRMQAELIHVSRLSAMGTMASTLAHELNQPLTALGNFINGAKRIAKRAENADPALEEALDAAEAGALRAAEIVRRLRELVSRGTVSAMDEHLPRLIEDAAVLAFLDEDARGIRHRLDLDPAATWVRADRVQIQQVLINLVRNAVEAMEGTAGKKEICVSTRAVGRDMVEIAVADSGAGLRGGDVDSLFSQFVTTKKGGMGIGLPISRTIVEAHRGKIWGEERPEGGAIFRFTLPRVRPRREKAPPL
jgi:PAS domain S-box-containing protein